MNINNDIQGVEIQINAIKAQMYDLQQLLDRAYQVKSTLIQVKDTANTELCGSQNITREGNELNVDIAYNKEAKRVHINNNGAVDNVELGATDELILKPDGGLEIKMQKEQSKAV